MISITSSIKSQAPWRIPGNYEIPDIIKEAWEKNKDKIMNNNQQHQSKHNNIPKNQHQLDPKSSLKNQPTKVNLTRLCIFIYIFISSLEMDTRCKTVGHFAFTTAHYQSQT